ncbi:hypothetical protein LCGC14_1836770 [marine sediment metagenome]|uniref:Uncharacterized protein n=1 Tax=marine sediment metagenome TaxID=412755 RepID=A0A0F9GEE6_9ZZZZ
MGVFPHFNEDKRQRNILQNFFFYKYKKKLSEIKIFKNLFDIIPIYGKRAVYPPFEMLIELFSHSNDLILWEIISLY